MAKDGEFSDVNILFMGSLVKCLHCSVRRWTTIRLFSIPTKTHHPHTVRLCATVAWVYFDPPFGAAQQPNTLWHKNLPTKV